MKRHGSSHGLAVLVCSLSSGILVKIGYDHYPQIITKIEVFCLKLMRLFSIDFSPKYVATIALATLLAVVWGMAFSFLHSD